MAGQISEPIRVVVTAVGAVTAQGASADAFWEGVKAGRVAIRPVRQIPMEGYSTRIGGEVQEEVVPEHSYRHPEGHPERVIDFALKAAEDALATSGIEIDRIPAGRWGAVIGTCNAGLLSGREWYKGRMAGETPDPELTLLVPPQAIP